MPFGRRGVMELPTGGRSPRPRLGECEELFAHVAACMTQRHGRQTGAEEVIGLAGNDPVLRTADRGDDDAFEWPDGMTQPQTRPVLECRGIEH